MAFTGPGTTYARRTSSAARAASTTDSAVDVLVPTAYTLPTAGTPISLAFILFAAWFAGAPTATWRPTARRRA